MDYQSLSRSLHSGMLYLPPEIFGENQGIIGWKSPILLSNLHFKANMLFIGGGGGSYSCFDPAFYWIRYLKGFFPLRKLYLPRDFHFHPLHFSLPNKFLNSNTFGLNIYFSTNWWLQVENFCWYRLPILQQRLWDRNTVCLMLQVLLSYHALLPSCMEQGVLAHLYTL